MTEPHVPLAKPLNILIMAAPHSEWTVLPHGELIAVDDSILTVVGTANMPVGTFQRRMNVVRLAGGGAVIYSPIALDEPQMQRLEAFGMPSYLVIPGSHHRLDAKIWKQRYPDARVVTAEGAREAVAKILPVDTITPDFGDRSVTFVTVPGTKEDEAALTISTAAGTTLILNDIIANLHNVKGLDGVVAKIFGFAGGKPQVPLPEKLGVIDDKAALASQFRQWAADPKLIRIIVSHGEIIEGDPAAALIEVAKSLE